MGLCGPVAHICHSMRGLGGRVRPLSHTTFWKPNRHHRFGIDYISAHLGRLESRLIMELPHLSSFAVVVVVLILVVYLQSVVKWRKSCHGRPLPPGPQPHPVWGNMFDMPKGRQWIGFRDLCRQYSESNLKPTWASSNCASLCQRATLCIFGSLEKTLSSSTAPK